MAVVDVKEIIGAGVHFGHRASRWHPKMAPFIFGKRNLIHIIDVRETLKGIVRASNFLSQVAAQGKEIVFVGTKRQAKSIVQREAQRCGNHWVSERWLGGTLTNIHTIRKRLKRLDELEALEETGEINQHSKKQVSRLRRERRKICTNLDGLRKMEKLPAALVAVDIRRERIAVREARKCGIPVIALVDTDCDPDLVDIIIPGNDDAFRSIEIILNTLAEAIMVGKEKHAAVLAEEEKKRLEEEEERKKAKEKVELEKQEELAKQKERDEIFRKAREAEKARGAEKAKGAEPEEKATGAGEAESADSAPGKSEETPAAPADTPSEEAPAQDPASPGEAQDECPQEEKPAESKG